MGHIFFSLHTTPLSKVTGRHIQLKFHFYADDTYLYMHLTHKSATKLLTLNRCLDDVKKWPSANKHNLVLIKQNLSFLVQKTSC